MNDATILPFSFPAVGRKKVTADFDPGRLTSDGGVMLLSIAERRLGIAERHARAFPDRRDPSRITHTLADMIRARTFAIACGYEDADDLDCLRTDPAFKLACGRLPRQRRGPVFAADPAAAGERAVAEGCDPPHLCARGSMIASYEREPASVILDIDDTCDVVHGHQQLSLFNAHYDERCFLPIHVYDTEKSRPVAVVLRPGKTLGGVEVRAHLRRLTHRIRALAKDPHPVSRRRPLRPARGDGVVRGKQRRFRVRARRIKAIGAQGRGNGRHCPHRPRWATNPSCAAMPKPTTRPKSWNKERRAVARIEATRLGLDIRFIVTNLAHGSPEWLYDSLYCARGQAENLIKLHKTQLASDRTSCRSAVANQVRLVLHTAAYWLMLAVRDAIPKVRDLAKAEFATLRLRLLKIAARIVETASRVRLAFAACCPEADLFRGLPAALMPCGP